LAHTPLSCFRRPHLPPPLSVDASPFSEMLPSLPSLGLPLASKSHHFLVPRSLYPRIHAGFVAFPFHRFPSYLSLFSFFCCRETFGLEFCEEAYSLPAVSFFPFPPCFFNPRTPNAALPATRKNRGFSVRPVVLLTVANFVPLPVWGICFFVPSPPFAVVSARSRPFPPLSSLCLPPSWVFGAG